MSTPTAGDLLSNLTEMLELDMVFDPAETDKLASTINPDALMGEKVASVALQDEINEALIEYEKTAGGNLNPFPGTATPSAKGTQSQQTVQVKGGGRSTETPGRGTEIAKQTDSSGLTGATGKTEKSENDSSESAGTPAPGQEMAAAKHANIQLGLLAQSLFTDLTEGALERATIEAIDEHQTKLAAARKRLAEGSNRRTEGETEENEDEGSSEEEANEKQADLAPGNRFLRG